MIKIRQLKMGYLLSKDMGAQTRFYQEALGLKLQFRDGDRWAQFDAGGTAVALASPEEASPATQGTVLVFEVESLDGLVDEIEKYGGRSLGSRDMGAHGTVHTVLDPDGNIVQFFQRGSTPVRQ
jgi:predicted enzyme related to lactoylglutathione lyase